MANENIAPIGTMIQGAAMSERALHDPFYPRFWPERISQPNYYGKGAGKGIFVVDMGELFGDWIPEKWQRDIFAIIKLNPLHRFYLLTKQPQNLIKLSPFPDNCWVGVTATDADMLFDALNHLDDIQCSIRYASLEPLLSNPYLVDLPAHLAGTLDWLIIGAQTNPYKAPKLEWVEEIIRAADKAGIPVFLKNNLMPILENRAPFFSTYKMNQGKFTQYPRQEMPSVADNY